MKIADLLMLCWIIANEEAKRLGATEILPIHFLLAAMKIIDPKFPEQLDKLNVSSEDWVLMCKEAQSVRAYIDIPPDRVEKRRRTLRRILHAKQNRPPVTEEGMLHRSADLKRAFADAMQFMKGDILTLYDVIQSLFDLELISLDDVDAKPGPV